MSLEHITKSDGDSYLDLRYQLDGNNIYVPVNVKEYGVLGDGITDDTAAVDALFETYKEGGTLIFPKGVYVFSSESKILGNGNTIGNFNIIGEGSIVEDNLRSGDLTDGTVFKFTSATANGLVLDSIDGDTSDYSNIIKNISIKGVSFYGSTTGALLDIRRVPRSLFQDISIYNGGAGTALKVFDAYTSVFDRVLLTGQTSRIAGSTGLWYDTYEGSGGMVDFRDCNSIYFDEGGLIGTDSSGAVSYGGLQSISFYNTQFNQSNTNLRISSPTTVAERTDHQINFTGCYFELHQNVNIKITNGVMANFTGSHINSTATKNTFEIGGATAAEYTGIVVNLDGCWLTTPSASGSTFYVYDDADTQFSLKNTTFRNLGGEPFEFESANTFNGAILLDNLTLKAVSDANFLSAEAKKYVTSESAMQSWVALINTDLDRSAALTVPAKINCQTLSAAITISLPTSVSMKDGSSVFVYKQNTANTVTIDSGTGNTISVAASPAQTYVMNNAWESVKLTVYNNGAVLKWYAENFNV